MSEMGVLDARIRDYILEQYPRVLDAHDKASNQWSQYLLFVNSGGAAAVLAFLGTDKADPEAWNVQVTLAAFVLGLIIVGVARAGQSLQTLHRVRRMTILTAKLKLDNRGPTSEELNAIYTTSNAEKWYGRSAHWAELLSFVCACVALLVGCGGALLG